jgi:hypothetical protein
MFGRANTVKKLSVQDMIFIWARRLIGCSAVEWHDDHGGEPIQPPHPKWIAIQDIDI